MFNQFKSKQWQTIYCFKFSKLKEWWIGLNTNLYLPKEHSTSQNVNGPYFMAVISFGALYTYSFYEYYYRSLNV